MPIYSLLFRGCFSLAAVTSLGVGGVAGCHHDAADRSSSATQTVTAPASLSNRHVLDTLYLSDYGTRVPYSDAQAGTVVSLPQVLVLRNCQFDGPVYAGRPNETVVGGYLDLSQSSFGGALDLSGLHLSHDLLLAATTTSTGVDLSMVSVAGQLDLSHARVSGEIVLANAKVGELQARLLMVGGGLNAQRLRVVHNINFMEAEVGGYFDLSYVRCLGESFFDLCRNRDRVVLDHGDYHGSLSLSQVKWPSVSMRFVRARGNVVELPELTAVQGEGLRVDLEP